MRTASILITLAIGSALFGCASGETARNEVHFNAFNSIKFQPTERVTFVRGSIDEARELHEQSSLPHKTRRESFALQSNAHSALTSQLGSDDYVLLGEVYGAGNEHSNVELLQSEIRRRAAAVGGDVVLLHMEGIDVQPFVESRPGRSMTYFMSAGYAATIHRPGRTYAGVAQRPYAAGLVFRHAPDDLPPFYVPAVMRVRGFDVG